MSNNILTQQELKRILHYNPDTGIFTRLVRAAPRAIVGDVAGSINSHGYVKIFINKVRYSAHRLAFLYMTGQMPEYDTDHINGIKSDNRWTNLRKATTQENMRNRNSFSNNKSGYVGVFKRGNRWIAQVTVNNKPIHLGSYLNIDDAINARKLKAIECYGEFYRELI